MSVIHAKEPAGMFLLVTSMVKTKSRKRGIVKIINSFALAQKETEVSLPPKQKLREKHNKSNKSNKSNLSVNWPISRLANISPDYVADVLLFMGRPPGFVCVRTSNFEQRLKPFSMRVKMFINMRAMNNERERRENCH